MMTESEGVHRDVCQGQSHRGTFLNTSLPQRGQKEKVQARSRLLFLTYADCCYERSTPTLKPRQRRVLCPEGTSWGTFPSSLLFQTKNLS